MLVKVLQQVVHPQRKCTYAIFNNILVAKGSCKKENSNYQRKYLSESSEISASHMLNAT